MNIEEFRANIDHYGIDINEWPVKIRQKANDALSSSNELQTLFDEEKMLRETLNLRTFDEPSSNLETRIISAANIEPLRQRSIFEFVNNIFTSFNLPNPAFALSMVLVIGITLGYIVNNTGDEINNENLFANEISFYDGDFYE